MTCGEVGAFAAPSALGIADRVVQEERIAEDASPATVRGDHLRRAHAGVRTTLRCAQVHSSRSIQTAERKSSCIADCVNTARRA
jgi:hypothetical protein